MSGIDLDGTVVAMTGASVGLGRSMSLALAKAGARVVLAAPEIDLLEAVAAEIEAKAGPGPGASGQDRHHRPHRLRAAARREHPPFGRLQVLVNNARRPVRGPGLPPAGNFLPFWESNPDIWQESVQVNVNGTFLISHVVTPHLIRTAGAASSTSTPASAACRRAATRPTASPRRRWNPRRMIFAADLAGTGVTVNTLLPGGACDTDPNRPPDPELKLLPVDIMDAAIVWLASKRSDGKTGGRYIGRLWNDKLPPDEAAAGAFTPPVFRTGD